MDAAELDYDLPAASIAQHPVEPRDAARLLVDPGPDRAVGHRTVADLDQLLEPDDIVVLNDTRVIPARLHLRKPTGGAVEVLLLERRPEGWWEALVRPGRRVAAGTVLHCEPTGNPQGQPRPLPDIEVTVGGAVGADGRRRVDLHGAGPDGAALGDDGLLAAIGEVPLPPYIHEPLADPERYQTVFAAHPGSVAAPTAGLHLTEEGLARLEGRGVTILRIELVVGLGTFRPITAERVEDHPMHAERYRVPTDVADALADHQERRRQGGRGRVVAVGTTVVRALESWAATGAAEGSTDLFIRGDYPFLVIDRLLTNFHVPRSSLLALVEAFIGPRWRDLYATAQDEGYRFLSFGDAMLLSRAEQPGEASRSRSARRPSAGPSGLRPGEPPADGGIR